MKTTDLLSTHEACERLSLSEPSLRYHLRQVGAPRPQMHPTLRVFLWTEADVLAMAEFIGRPRGSRSMRVAEEEA